MIAISRFNCSFVAKGLPGSSSMQQTSGGSFNNGEGFLKK